MACRVFDGVSWVQVPHEAANISLKELSLVLSCCVALVVVYCTCIVIKVYIHLHCVVLCLLHNAAGTITSSPP